MGGWVRARARVCMCVWGKMPSVSVGRGTSEASKPCTAQLFISVQLWKGLDPPPPLGHSFQSFCFHPATRTTPSRDALPLTPIQVPKVPKVVVVDDSHSQLQASSLATLSDMEAKGRVSIQVDPGPTTPHPPPPTPGPSIFPPRGADPIRSVGRPRRAVWPPPRLLWISEAMCDHTEGVRTVFAILAKAIPSFRRHLSQPLWALSPNQLPQFAHSGAWFRPPGVSSWSWVSQATRSRHREPFAAQPHRIHITHQQLLGTAKPPHRPHIPQAPSAKSPSSQVRQDVP